MSPRWQNFSLLCPRFAHPELVCFHLISSSFTARPSKWQQKSCGRLKPAGKTQVHSISLLYRKKSRSRTNSLSISNELLIQRFLFPLLLRHWWFNEFQSFLLHFNLDRRNNRLLVFVVSVIKNCFLNRIRNRLDKCFPIKVSSQLTPGA